MLRYLLSFLVVLMFQHLSAQNFTEVPHYNNFEKAGDGTSAIADVNGNGCPDIITSGVNSRVFLNNSEGHFVLYTKDPFVAVNSGAMGVGDLTGDGSPDVLISGRTIPHSESEVITKLYVNNGNGDFNEFSNSVFPGVEFGSVALSDLNGDGFLDVLITGRSAIGRITKLYFNDGSGGFEEAKNTPFIGLDNSMSTVGDVNGDNHPDVILAGDTGILQSSKGDVKDLAVVTKLYLNDGAGRFTEVANAPFIGVSKGDIALADINDDTYPDVVLSGEKYLRSRVSILYTNDGSGQFSEVKNTPFDPVNNGCIAVADFNGDQSPDILLTGQPDWSTATTQLYKNDGDGNFVKEENPPFVDIANGTISICDLNGDHLKDVLITGSLYRRTMKVYINEGLGQYTERRELPFKRISSGSVVLEDFNGDFHPDLFLTGYAGGKAEASIYWNDGDGNFTEIIDTSFLPVYEGSVAASDINGDSYVDLLAIGKIGWKDPVARLYLGDSIGGFSEVVGSPFIGAARGAVGMADVNGDNFPDAIITGRDSANTPLSLLYMNNGRGQFFVSQKSPFINVGDGALALEDVNGDNFPDAILTGFDSTMIRHTKLYTNDGTGHFKELPDVPFINVAHGAIAVRDVNNDDHPDVLISGETGPFALSANLYLNDGAGHFNEVMDTPFEGLSRGTIAFADLNNDGHYDVFMTGMNRWLQTVTNVYIGDGSGRFHEEKGLPFVGVYNSSVGVADVNGDNYPDVLISGYDGHERHTILYINDGEDK